VNRRSRFLKRRDNLLDLAPLLERIDTRSGQLLDRCGLKPRLPQGDVANFSEADISAPAVNLNSHEPAPPA
jgi:hypothetical protein